MVEMSYFHIQTDTHCGEAKDWEKTLLQEYIIDDVCVCCQSTLTEQTL